MRRFLVALALVALLAGSSLAAPGSYFSKTDSEALKTLINGEKKSGEFGSLANNVAAVDALSLLGSPITDASKLCDSAAHALEGDLLSIVKGFHLKAALKCAETKIPDAAMQKIEEALTKTEEPVSQLLALVATSKIAAKGVDKAKVDEAVKELLEHLSNDGFKVHEDLENGSGYYTALLLESLAALKTVMSKETKDSVSSSAVDSVKSYLSSSAVQDESTLAYPHQDASVSDYVSTASLLDSLIKFNKAFSTKLGFNDDKLNKLARFFLSHAHIASVEEARAVLLGLNALNAGTWRKPLIVTATQTTLKAAAAKGEESQSIKFQITDIFGAPATKQPKLFLVSLTSSESTTPLITNQELTQAAGAAENSGLFEFNLLAIKPAPGSYKLSLSVTPSKVSEGTQPYAAIKLTTRLVQVISSIELSDLSLSVRKSKDSEDFSSSAAKHTFSYGAKPANLEVSSDDVLDFSFVVKSKHANKQVTVQQAFVLLVQGDAELFFVAKYDAAKKAYTVSAPLAKHIVRFGSGGKFQVKLLVGDSYIDNSIAWDVATMDVKLSEATSQKIAASASSAAEGKPEGEKKAQLASVSSYKPQILHKFRPADKRANVFVSRVFTAITLAPLAFFVLGVLFVKLNFGNCPSGMGLIWVLLFHASILLVGYAIVLFFLRNNLFQTLQLLLYFVPISFLTGLQALRAVAQKRAQNLAIAKDPQNH